MPPGRARVHRAQNASVRRSQSGALKRKNEMTFNSSHRKNVFELGLEQDTLVIGRSSPPSLVKLSR